MKHLLFVLLAIACSGAIARAQEETPLFLYLINDFSLPDGAVFSGPPAPPPGFPGEPQTPDSPSPTTSFLGLSDNATVHPPDTHGAVGLSNLVTMLNSQIRIHDRSGTALATTNLSSFWNAVGSYNNITDPRIVYDPFANRWIASAMVNFTNTTRTTPFCSLCPAMQIQRSRTGINIGFEPIAVVQYGQTNP